VFYGSLVPLVTPFRDNQLDETALRQLIDWHVASGTHGVVITGTTGEPSSLSFEERARVIDVAVAASNGRIPVLAGTGSVNHAESLALTAHGERAGADAIVLIIPYYVRPSQSGLYGHFRALAESTRLPVMLYNSPGRAAANLEPDTLMRLARDCPNIIGVKESNKDFEHVARVFHRTRQLDRPFHVYSGIELLCFPVLALGGSGMVSATGNVMPREVAELYNLSRDGQWDAARELHYHLTPINDALFLESNPAPAKTALGWMGKIAPEIRLPLAQLSDANQAKLRETMASYNLLPVAAAAD
jgi:4-hydroxy-tetrahydrodipicolinate synthase